jgi:hypothetical protein
MYEQLNSPPLIPLQPPQVLHPEFHFENCEDDGIGPESLQSFVAGCQGRQSFRGATFEVGIHS